MKIRSNVETNATTNKWTSNTNEIPEDGQNMWKWTNVNNDSVTMERSEKTNGKQSVVGDEPDSAGGDDRSDDLEWTQRLHCDAEVSKKSYNIF